jgi:hypothetical protein
MCQHYKTLAFATVSSDMIKSRQRSDSDGQEPMRAIKQILWPLHYI